MRALKAIVIVMGIMIVIGLGAVGYGIFKNVTSLGKKSEVGLAEHSSSAVSYKWEQDLILALPLGCIIGKINTNSNQIYVTISGTSQKGRSVCSRVIIVDATSGQRLGTIKAIP